MKRRDFTRSFGRAYDGPRLRNPFFAAPTPAKAVKYLMLGLVISAVVGIPIVFVYAPFMRYRDLQINGLTTLDSAQVTSTIDESLNRRRLLIIPGRHLFFASKEGIVVALNAKFHFAELALRRDGRTLVIDARERITEIAWTAAGKTYFVDLAGVAVRDATPEALAMIAARRTSAADVPVAPGVQPTMPIIDVDGESDKGVGSVVIDADHLQRILAIDAALRTRGVKPLVYTLATANAAWLTLTTEGGPSLLFDITVAQDDALAMYDAFIREKNGDVSRLLYIDLRFGNHVYIKER